MPKEWFKFSHFTFYNNDNPGCKNYSKSNAYSAPLYTSDNDICKPVVVIKKGALISLLSDKVQVESSFFI